jgi:hypothetical protein
MLQPRLLTISAPQRARRTRWERRPHLNFHNNIKDLFVNLSQRRFFLESWLKKIQDVNASEKWSKMKRDAAIRDVHRRGLRRLVTGILAPPIQPDVLSWSAHQQRHHAREP